jgi:hypoxanthine-DNA glycosylase
LNGSGTRRRIAGFLPVARPGARVLVLGSMPGVASLAASEYYAHPRNLFWPIMAALLDFDPKASYAKRTAALAAAGIALWDVVGSCVRPVSLDAAIDDDTLVANDFATFFRRHRRIARVCFNGRKAESAWRRHVRPELPPTSKQDYRLLPTTSPAHAGMSYRRKLQVWRSAIAC